MIRISIIKDYIRQILFSTPPYIPHFSWIRHVFLVGQECHPYFFIMPQINVSWKTAWFRSRTLPELTAKLRIRGTIGKIGAFSSQNSLAHILASTHAQTLTHMHTRAHTRTHAHTHAHMHTGTHTQRRTWKFAWKTVQRLFHLPCNYIMISFNAPGKVYQYSNICIPIYIQTRVRYQWKHWEHAKFRLLVESLSLSFFAAPYGWGGKAAAVGLNCEGSSWSTYRKVREQTGTVNVSSNL